MSEEESALPVPQSPAELPAAADSGVSAGSPEPESETPELQLPAAEPPTASEPLLLLEPPDPAEAPAAPGEPPSPAQPLSPAQPASAIPLPAPRDGPAALGLSASGPARARDRAFGVQASPASDDDRLMSGLAWLSMVILQMPVVSLIMLVAESNKNRPFQRYHAVTSLLFWLAGVAYEILAGIAYTILTVLTAGCLAVCLWPLFFLPHLAALYYAYLAYRGRQPEIPVISDLARKEGWSGR